MTMFSLFVVDDEDIAREGVALALKKQYQVKCYANAEEALDAMAVQPPDLVLLDIGLPGMSGTEALEIIKSRYPDYRRAQRS
jgi:CheY-like chemotaxis protein